MKVNDINLLWFNHLKLKAKISINSYFNNHQLHHKGLLIWRSMKFIYKLRWATTTVKTLSTASRHSTPPINNNTQENIHQTLTWTHPTNSINRRKFRKPCSIPHPVLIKPHLSEINPSKIVFTMKIWFNSSQKSAPCKMT